MKVLWLVNTIFPALREELGASQPISGGWLHSMHAALREYAPDVSIAVAVVHKGSNFRRFDIDGSVYYVVPHSRKEDKKYLKKVEYYCLQIIADFQPDIIHLHGTEFGRRLAVLRAAADIKTIASIQGLVSVIDRYFYAGINHFDFLRSTTLIEVIRGTTIWKQKRSMTLRGNYERETIRRSRHIIGRTSWDKMHTLAINPNAHYHFCNEVLRSEFYKHHWKYESCEKHSIILSSSASPLKGFHQLAKAIPLILKEYPDTKVYVAYGHNLKERKTLLNRLRIKSYDIYITRLLKKLNIKDKFVFYDSLSEKEMCQRFLKSNVFICPSSIENSSNSLSEAQLLGVPCIASYVGGNPDMMRGDENNLYRFEEVEMLASKVCAIFREGASVSTDKMREVAQKRHCPEANAKNLTYIYKMILD